MVDFGQHKLLYSELGIENLLNPTEEDDVIECLTSASQLEFFIGSSDDTESDAEDDDDNEVYFTAEKHNALAIATALPEKQERMTTEAQSIVSAT